MTYVTSRNRLQDPQQNLLILKHLKVPLKEQSKVSRLVVNREFLPNTPDMWYHLRVYDHNYNYYYLSRYILACTLAVVHPQKIKAKKYCYWYGSS